MGDQLVELLQRKVRLAPDVPELEAGVVVPRVLVVDQAEGAADVDEVLGEEVVVARDRALVADGHGLLDCPHLRLELEVAFRESKAPLLHDPQVASLDVEHVEVIAKPSRAMELPAGCGSEIELVAAPEVLGGLRRTLDELEHEHRLLGQVGDHGSSHSGFGGRD